MLATFTFLSLVPSGEAQQKEPGETQVLKWKDGKQAVYLLAFDDACPTHLTHVVPELTRRGLPGNFYINPGKGVFIGKQAQWEKLTTNPNVIFCNHTMTHVGAVDVAQLDDEITRCNETLRRLIPNQPWPRLISFGKPGGVPWKVTSEEVAQTLAKHHLVDRPPFSGPPINYKSAEALLATVDQALKNGSIGHADFHGVGGDWLSTPLEWFTALLDKLEQEKERIWVASHIASHQYQKERETAKISIVKTDDRLIQLNLTSSLNSALYNHPLTLETSIPEGWTNVSVIQGETELNATIQGTSVRYNAIPNAADILIKPL